MYLGILQLVCGKDTAEEALQGKKVDTITAIPDEVIGMNIQIVKDSFTDYAWTLLRKEGNRSMIYTYSVHV